MEIRGSWPPGSHLSDYVYTVCGYTWGNGPFLRSVCVLSWFGCVRHFARLLCPWESPGKNTGMGCHFLLQEIFLTQRSNPHLLRLLHWQEGSLPLVLPVPRPGIEPWPPALAAQNLSPWTTREVPFSGESSEFQRDLWYQNGEEPLL